MAYVPVDYEHSRYSAEALTRFSTEVFEKAGLTEEHARELAGYLVATDLRGVLSHGTSGVPGYAASFRDGNFNPKPAISVSRDTGATVQLDGNGSIGHLLSARTMHAAVEKAAQFGVGMGFGRYCGHTGSIGNWTRIATDAGMIGLFTSTAVAPSDFETVQTVTNVFRDYPISVGFPAASGQPPLVVDVGTLLAPLKIQEEIAEITTLPLIKGFALQTISLMLTMPIAAQAPVTPDPFPAATCSLIALVLNPAVLGEQDAYEIEGQRIREALHKMEPMPGFDRVLLPGELEAERESDFIANGIPLSPDHIKRLAEAGRMFGVPLYWE